MSGAVVVFAKPPGLGIAKTRIARTEGARAADLIYRELLAVTGRQVRSFTHLIAYAGADNPGELRNCFPHAISFFQQRGATLGERLADAADRFLPAYPDGLVFVGCDCPALTREDLTGALTMLAKSDVVIGPASDGGYYLIGCRRKGTVVFSARSWSSSRLLTETKEICAAHTLSVYFLTERDDIDTSDAYRRWKNPVATHPIGENS